MRSAIALRGSPQIGVYYTLTINMRSAFHDPRGYLLHVHFITVKISIVRRRDGEVQTKGYEHSISVRSRTITNYSLE